MKDVQSFNTYRNSDIVEQVIRCKDKAGASGSSSGVGHDLRRSMLFDVCKGKKSGIVTTVRRLDLLKGPGFINLQNQLLLCHRLPGPGMTNSKTLPNMYTNNCKNKGETLIT